MKYLLTAFVFMLLAGCGDPVSDRGKGSPRESTPLLQEVSVERHHDPGQIARGSVLYQKNCMQCHGEQAQGAPNWQKRDADGKFPPPPLNGTGHTWHHPTKALKHTINNGTGNIGGNMPAFRTKLNDQEIDDILEFVKSKWPDPLYEAWYRNEQRSLSLAK